MTATMKPEMFEIVAYDAYVISRPDETVSFTTFANMIRTASDAAITAFLSIHDRLDSADITAYLASEWVASYR